MKVEIRAMRNSEVAFWGTVCTELWPECSGEENAHMALGFSETKTVVNYQMKL